MFSVYGIKGRLFSGPLEQMRQVPGVKPLSGARVVAAIGQDPSASDSGDNLRRSVPEPQSHSPLAAYAQGNAAVRYPLRQVRDVMSRKPLVLLAETVAQEAWQTLADKGFAQAPVADAQGMLVGLLLRADLMRPELMPGPNTHPLAWRAWLAQTVAEVMCTPVPSVGPDADLRHVARVLLDTGLPGLPVVDAHGGVTGFVSRSDLLRAVVHDPPLDLWG